MRDLSTIIAVDFDGTCVTHEYPRIGRSVGAEPVLLRLAGEGARLILWTMRSGPRLREAVDWFEERHIPLYGVQRNPTQDDWTDSPKAYAHLYIDDAALGCPLSPGFPGERPYVDWPAVAKLLWPDDSTPSPGLIEGRAKNIVCPHCGVIHSDGEEQAAAGSEKCDACGEPFDWSRVVTVTYITKKL